MTLPGSLKWIAGIVLAPIVPAALFVAIFGWGWLRGPIERMTAVIDGVWSTVGSTNLDWRSFLDNDEVNAVVLGRDFAGQMLVMFARDLETSEAIDPERWERRSLSLRLKEWMARVFGRLL